MEKMMIFYLQNEIWTCIGQIISNKLLAYLHIFFAKNDSRTYLNQ
jgi:hypothetical protein